MADPAHSVKVVGQVIETRRLVLRPWQLSDSADALTIFGTEEVTRWLAPAAARVGNEDAMRAQLASWINFPDSPPTGHWAVLDHRSGRLVGAGQIIPLPPENNDLLVGFEIVPSQWGRGFGTEVGHALAHYAFENGQDEVFAVARARNARARAVAEHVGMEWVGETDKYFGTRLNVWRLRRSDLDRPRLDPGPLP